MGCLKRFMPRQSSASQRVELRMWMTRTSSTTWPRDLLPLDLAPYASRQSRQNVRLQQAPRCPPPARLPLYVLPPSLSVHSLGPPSEGTPKFDASEVPLHPNTAAPSARVAMRASAQTLVMLLRGPAASARWC